MRLLFLGDIVGQSGRKGVENALPLLRQQYEPDIIIANGENAAHGKGITRKIYTQFMKMGIDVVTLGNHAFSKADIFAFIEDADHMVRPANMDPIDAGQSTCVIYKKGKTIAISNLCGEIFMHNTVESPFDCMEMILKEIDADIHFVDFHAEATSEKIAFLYQFAGRIGAVIGTHTHVQTADERIVNGTAGLSDAGMCGAYESILGRDVEEILTRFTSDEKTKYTIAEGEAIICGCIIDFDDVTNQATHIERIQLRPTTTP
ncbi:MAG: TIGR00282 family metallophosphoesterase [Erysipelotrichaceae bacterium]